LNRNIISFALAQAAILFGLVWFIAGNDRLFRSTVPIEQRLVSRNDSIRKKAQQELLGLDDDGKKQAVNRLIPALENDDAFVRKWAAISLALVGPAAQEAIPSLLQGVSDRQKDAAQAARVALSEIGAPDAQQLPSLIKALADPRDSVRCEAALSIGKMGPAAKRAMPIFMDVIQRPVETPSCMEDALASLGNSVPAALPPVIGLLANGNVEVRCKAARVLALAGVKAPDEIAALFEAIGHEEDHKVRALLAKALQFPSTPEPAPSSVLAAALDDAFVPVRLEAARRVRQTAPQGQQYLPLILRMLKDQEPAIRRLGLETLRRCGLRSTELMRKVAKAQRDSDPGVRCRAAEALIEAGAPDRVSTSLLIDDLRKDEDTARCSEDVLSLAGLFDLDVVHSMTRLVEEEKDPDIRSRAARVLMHLGPRAREAIPVLLHAQRDDVPGAAMALKAIRPRGTRKKQGVS